MKGPSARPVRPGRSGRSGRHESALQVVRLSGLLGLGGLRRHFADFHGSTGVWDEMQAAARRWASSVESAAIRAATDAGVAPIVLLRSLLLSASEDERPYWRLVVKFGAFAGSADGFADAARAAIKAAVARKPSRFEPKLSTAFEALAEVGVRPKVGDVELLPGSPANLLALSLDLEPPLDRKALADRLLMLKGLGSFVPAGGRPPSRRSRGAPAVTPTTAFDSAALGPLAVILAGWIALHPACRLTLADLSNLGSSGFSLLEQVEPETLLLPAEAGLFARLRALSQSGEREFDVIFERALSDSSDPVERVKAWERLAEIAELHEAAPHLAAPVLGWLSSVGLPGRVSHEPAPESVIRSLAGRGGELAGVLRALARPAGERRGDLRPFRRKFAWASALFRSDALVAFKRSIDARQRLELLREAPEAARGFAELVGRCANLGPADLPLLLKLGESVDGGAAVEAIASSPEIRDLALAQVDAAKWTSSAATTHGARAAALVASITAATWKGWSRLQRGVVVRKIIRSSPDATSSFVRTMLDADDHEAIFRHADHALSPADFVRILLAWRKSGGPAQVRKLLLESSRGRGHPPRWITIASSQGELDPEAMEALVILVASEGAGAVRILVAQSPKRFLPVVRRILGDALTFTAISRHHDLLVEFDQSLDDDARAALVELLRRPDGAWRAAATPSVELGRWELDPAEAMLLEIACISSLRELPFLRRCLRLSLAAPKGTPAGARFDGLYTTYSRPKRKGGTRTITAPSDELKRFQRRLLENGFARIPVHEAAHGFVRGRGVASNAAVHVGQPLVVNVDVKGFFPNTSRQRVLEACRHLADGKLSRAALQFVADLCCCRGALPTGAPTSPAIANVVLRRVDRALATRCAAIGVRYTRYADDLTFSGDDRAKRIVPFVRSLLREIGYEIDPSKTQLYRRGRQQVVTGLTVNDRVNVRRSERRRLRAAVHARITKGSSTWFGQPMEDSSLVGRIAMLHAVDPRRAKELRDRLGPSVPPKRNTRAKDGEHGR